MLQVGSHRKQVLFVAGKGKRMTGFLKMCVAQIDGELKVVR